MWRTRVAKLCLIGLPGVLALASCGGGGADDEYLRKAFESMDEKQAEALRDGRASRGEYEAGVRRARQCLEDLGMELEPGPLVGEGAAANVAGRFPPGEVDDAKVEGCNRFFTPLAEVYILQHQRSDADIAAARKAAIECLQKLGVAVEASAPSNDVIIAAMGSNGEMGSRYEELECIEPLQTVSVSPPPGIDQALADWLEQQ